MKTMLQNMTSFDLLLHYNMNSSMLPEKILLEQCGLQIKCIG